MHLAYVREGGGRALIGARQWILRAQIEDPVNSLLMGLPADVEFRTKSQLAIDIVAGVLAGGTWLGFFCGNEVYGSCTQLREFFEGHNQAHVLRVARSFLSPDPGRIRSMSSAGTVMWAGEYLAHMGRHTVLKALAGLPLISGCTTCGHGGAARSVLQAGKTIALSHFGRSEIFGRWWLV